MRLNVGLRPIRILCIFLPSIFLPSFGATATETGKIGQANLDGSFIETLVLGKTAQYASLVVLPPRE